MEWIPRITPRWEPPLHLKPYVDVLERAPGANLRIVFAAPPQHGKTETVVHAICFWLRKWPALRFAYATYNDDRARRVSRKALVTAQRARVPLTVANGGLWLNEELGQVVWTSVGGGLTGEPIDGVMMVDDPLKDRGAAESQATRAYQQDWYHGTVESRLHPGSSVIVMATRWHPDDLSGYLVREQGFEYINLKAICDGEDMPAGDERAVGEALWEAHRPLSMLLERQLANQWNFASLYQGQPQPRGGTLFKTPTYYRELPTEGFRVVYGVDLAYTAKTRADWSVLVTLWVVPPAKTKRGEKQRKEDYLFYVVDVQRKQVEAPSFTLTLKAAFSTRRAKFYWYASGTEAGCASFIREKGIPLVVMDPKGRDKLTRSLTSSELWNLGRILVPEDIEAHPWQPVFVDELTSFTGAEQDVSDQTDAIVSGVDAALLYLDDYGVLGGGGRYT
jgi:predicted phage terminase large subunit-like protein